MFFIACLNENQDKVQIYINDLNMTRIMLLKNN